MLINIVDGVTFMRNIVIGLIGLSGAYKYCLAESILRMEKCAEFRPFRIKLKSYSVYLGIVVESAIIGGGLLSDCKKIFDEKIIIHTHDSISDLIAYIEDSQRILAEKMIMLLKSTCRKNLSEKLIDAHKQYASFYVQNRILNGIRRLITSRLPKIEVNLEMYGWIFKEVEAYQQKIDIDFTPQSLYYLNDTLTKFKQNQEIIEKILLESSILPRLRS